MVAPNLTHPPFGPPPPARPGLPARLARDPAGGPRKEKRRQRKAIPPEARTKTRSSPSLSALEAAFFSFSHLKKHFD